MAESATNNDEFLYFTVEGLRYEGLCGFLFSFKSQNPLIWSRIDLHYLRELILRENKLLRTVFLDVFEVYFTIDRSLIKIYCMAVGQSFICPSNLMLSRQSRIARSPNYSHK